MRYQFEHGEAVRVIRNVRNDGTFPGEKTGELLIRRGSIGYVRDIGTFLQDQIIYTVHFIDAGRLVGCREEELIGADEPWIPTRFESREKVRTRVPLGMGGEVVVPGGSAGEIIRVLRSEAGNSYQVLFVSHYLVVPEHALEPLGDGVCTN
ncbi:MAG TPA: nitrogen fixation protein NifZ [Gammaproteobacteria bacterium]